MKINFFAYLIYFSEQIWYNRRMINSLSTIDTPFASPHCTVKKIWKVCADSTYRIKRSHPDIENFVALFTLSGTGEVRTKGKTIRAAQSTLYLLRNEEILSYQTEKEQWQFYWVEFTLDTPFLPFESEISLSNQSDIAKTLSDCYAELGQAHSAQLSSCRFSLLLLTCLKNRYQTNVSFKQQLLENTLSYITQNIHRDIKISELAEKQNISPRYLNKLFQQELSVSPKEYILNLKMRAAEDLLLHTDMKLYTIALSLGFENQYYFSRIFKKYFGKSPSSFRPTFSKN